MAEAKHILSVFHMFYALMYSYVYMLWTGCWCCECTALLVYARGNTTPPARQRKLKVKVLSQSNQKFIFCMQEKKCLRRYIETYTLCTPLSWSQCWLFMFTFIQPELLCCFFFFFLPSATFRWGCYLPFLKRHKQQGFLLLLSSPRWSTLFINGLFTEFKSGRERTSFAWHEAAEGAPSLRSAAWMTEMAVGSVTAGLTGVWWWGQGGRVGWRWWPGPDGLHLSRDPWWGRLTSDTNALSVMSVGDASLFTTDTAFRTTHQGKSRMRFLTAWGNLVW